MGKKRQAGAMPCFILFYHRHTHRDKKEKKINFQLPSLVAVVNILIFLVLVLAITQG
jgi:hypothetical protein